MTAYVVGLTGPIGAGKSTVSALLREAGAHVIDADALVRDEQTRGTLGYTAIVQQFGTEILGEDKEIDRAKLASVVFSDPAQLRRLENIMHPRVAARVLEARSMVPDGEVLFVEAIKLIGGLSERLCDQIWVVIAPRVSLLERLRASRGMSEGEALARLGQQLDEDAFRARADLVIVNDGDRASLAKKVSDAWADLKARLPSAGPAA